MKNFEAYAAYYDLLYVDKDYDAEAAFIDGVLRKHGQGVKTLLELGCGTGKHAQRFAGLGYQAAGVDMSPWMIERAQRLKAEAGALSGKMEFILGDVRTVRTGNKYDSVLSLFHVVNYQNLEADLGAMFVTAATHLKPNGLFVFDSWYGPAVLTDRPARRTKAAANEKISLVRTATPTMYPNENRVEVAYAISIQDKTSGETHEVKEAHQMRYLFLPEVRALLDRAGMELLIAKEWMTDREPGFDTWSVYFVARKRA